MVRKFLKDIGGSYTIATVIAMVPIMGGLALAIDFGEMNRQRQATLNALDAACVATGRRVAEGVAEAELNTYAEDFFQANLGPVAPADSKLTLTMPTNAIGGMTLKCRAELVYRPHFYPAFVSLLSAGEADGSTIIDFKAHAEVRLKNTLEVALVLDNSGSMDLQGKGSGKKRLDLLKEAGKQLIDTISKQAAQMKQVDKPVQFALVPFAASVNIGSGNAAESWMDRDGVSPIHHENFEWSTFTSKNKKVELVGGIYYKKGNAWGKQKNQKVTRFTLYDDMRFVASYDTKIVDGKQKTITKYARFARWEGCVEARPHPYNTSDAAAVKSTPATLFVPMFAPDETDIKDKWNRPSNNNWWPDSYPGDDDEGEIYEQAEGSQRYMPKYFKPAPMAGGIAKHAMGINEGPNASCTTVPITPLVDVSTSAGVTKIKDAIEDMEALGGTNVPEGLAWGWRAVSGAAPFTQGRGDSEKGNDKVVIVLTDGENTYYTPGSVSPNPYSGGELRYGAHDLANNRSIYSSYGYTRRYDGEDSRLFQGTSSAVSKTGYSNANYGVALNEQMAAACGNAKAAGVIVMTVALDLDASNAAQKKQIDALTACASESRFQSNTKLFWNTTGGNLAETFEKIADELSNLRIVG